MPTYQQNGYMTGLTAGTQVGSTGEGRHLRLLESAIIHPTHTDGLVDKGDPIVTASGNIVGVSFNSASAATDFVSVDTEGLWALSVVGTDHNGNSAVVIGDELFIHRTTGIISKNINVNTHRHFGYALGPVVSAATTVIAVKVHWDPDDEAIVKVGASGAEFVHDEADYNFHEYRFDNGATSGDNRGFYLRLNLTGAGGGGESLRAFTVCDDVACSTAHGAHLSLGFDASGSITGLGVASRSTLHIPNVVMSGGTYAGAMSELYADGSTSDIGGTTEHSIHRFVLDGDPTGRATAINAFSFVNIPSGTGTEMLKTDMHTAAPTDGLRIIIDGVLFYIELVAG